MSIDDLTMAHDPDVRKQPVNDFATIARLLPDTLMGQILGYLSRAELKCFLRYKAPCSNGRPVSEVASFVLFEDIHVATPKALEILQNGNPDPEYFACLVKELSIPGFTREDMRDYLSRLLACGFGIQRLCVGNDTDYPITYQASLTTRYLPDIPKCHNIRSLTIGKRRRLRIGHEEPFVDFSELSVFPNLMELRWITLDSRLGSVQQILRDIHRHCPNLKILQAPWTDKLDQTSWSSIPPYTNLEKLHFRVDHGVRIDVRRMYECLSEFWTRRVAVRLGDPNCMQDIVRWMPELYDTIFREESARGESPEKMFEWLLQPNRHKLIKTTELYSGTTRTMLEALAKVDTSDEDGLPVEIPLTRHPLPRFITPNVTHLRFLNDRENIPSKTLPYIISSNPRLEELGIAVHVEHFGSSYDGSITAAKVPLIPGQNGIRTSGLRVGALTTVPAFSIRFTVQKDKEGRIKQHWRSEMVQHGQKPAAKELRDLNIFNVQDWVPKVWTEELLARTRKWEEEIRGWLALNPSLKKVYVVLNTDRQRYGTFTDRCLCTRT